MKHQFTALKVLFVLIALNTTFQLYIAYERYQVCLNENGATVVAPSSVDKMSY